MTSRLTCRETTDKLHFSFFFFCFIDSVFVIFEMWILDGFNVF